MHVKLLILLLPRKLPSHGSFLNRLVLNISYISYFSEHFLHVQLPIVKSIRELFLSWNLLTQRIWVLPIVII